MYYLLLTTGFVKTVSTPRCRSPQEQEELWVIATAAKGGTVLAARAAIEIGYGCRLLVGVGHRSSSQWSPAPVREHNPPYYSDIMLAIANAQYWPQYAGSRKVRCVFITRHPLSRLKSLYAYAYDGSEYGLVGISKELKQLHFRNISASFQRMYDMIGRGTMLESHQFLMINANRSDCIQVRFEDFQKDFDRAATKWLQGWGITDPALKDELLVRMRKHDLKRKSPEQLAMEHHVSGKGLDQQELAKIEQLMLDNHEIRVMLQKQAQDLGYQF